MSNRTKYKVKLMLQNGCTFATIEAFSVNTLAKAIAAEVVDAIKMDIVHLNVEVQTGAEPDPDAWKKIL